MRKKTDKNLWIQLSMYTGLSQDANKGYHWLQFSSRYRMKGDKFVTGVYQTSLAFYQFATDRMGTGGVHVDTLSKESPFYDESGEAKRSGIELTIWDHPDPNEDNEYTETGSVFDAYLVNTDNGKVYYHIHWERVSKKTDCVWKTEYANITGEQVKEIPPILRNEKLAGGWDEYNPETKKLTMPFTFNNPVAPKKDDKKK